MKDNPGTCPMTRRQLIDEYFIENRTKLIDIAAFLDRLSRSRDGSQEADFRMEAFREALGVLSNTATSKVQQVQMIFSDPTTEPLEKFDHKSARGAYDGKKQEVR